MIEIIKFELKILFRQLKLKFIVWKQIRTCINRRHEMNKTVINLINAKIAAKHLGNMEAHDIFDKYINACYRLIEAENSKIQSYQTLLILRP